METFRPREGTSIDETDLSITGEDQVFQLGLMECKQSNLQKRWWDENQMGGIVGFLMNHILIILIIMAIIIIIIIIRMMEILRQF